MTKLLETGRQGLRPGVTEPTGLGSSAMGPVTACKMSVVTQKSGHQMMGFAVSVCTTPAAPSPIPMPYPTQAVSAEGIADGPRRTKVNGSTPLNVGSCLSACHGNEPGTLKEVVSLNTAGKCYPTLGMLTVLIELGATCTTGSLGGMNKTG